jgi:hypothetical protein
MSSPYFCSRFIRYARMSTSCCGSSSETFRPLYLVTDDAPNPGAALKAYIREMRRWVDAVRSGTAITDLIPVDAPRTSGNAEDLAVRLDFMERNILERYREES